jgi:hypothetical protein
MIVNNVNVIESDGSDRELGNKRKYQNHVFRETGMQNEEIWENPRKRLFWR